MASERQEPLVHVLIYRGLDNARPGPTMQPSASAGAKCDALMRKGATKRAGMQPERHTEIETPSSEEHVGGGVV